MSRWAMLASSRSAAASRRSTGMPPARPADSWRMRRSPPEQGSSPSCRAVIAAYQSIAAIGVVPSLMLVPVSMKRLVKSSRCRNVPLLISSPTPASKGLICRELSGQRICG